MRLYLHRSGGTFVTQLFAAEKEIQRLPPEQRQEKRLAVEQPMLRAFWCWLDELSTQPLAGSLKKAVEYAQGQRSYMENYLKDPRYEISNNRAENKIHPFTVGRKNWLFSDTPAGAKSQRSDLQHCGNSKGKQPCAQRLYPVPFRESA